MRLVFLLLAVLLGIGAVHAQSLDEVDQLPSKIAS